MYEEIRSQNKKSVITCPQYKDGKLIATFYLYGFRKDYPLKLFTENGYTFYYKNKPITKDLVIKNGITKIVIKRERRKLLVDYSAVEYKIDKNGKILKKLPLKEPIFIDK